MTSITRILFWFFVGAALAGGIWAYYSIKNSKKPKLEALSVLPDSCLVYLNTTNFSELNKKINSQSLVFDKLKAFAPVKELCNTIHFFDSLTNTNDLIREELSENLLHLAVYDKNCDWLLCFNIKELGKQTQVFKNTSTLLGLKACDGELYTFNSPGKTPCYFNLNSGVAMLSNAPNLIKKATNSALSKFHKSAAYQDLQSTLSENNVLSIYVNHELYAANKACKSLNLSLHCKKGFLAAAVDIDPSEIKATGYTTIDSSEVLAALANQSARSPEDFIPLLPGNTLCFKAFGFGSFKNLIGGLTDYKQSSPVQFWKEARAEALYNLKTDFEENVKSHLLAFRTSNNYDYLAIEISDSTKAFEHLKFMSDSVFNAVTQQYRLKTADSEALFLFKPLYTGATNYAACLNSHIVFSTSKEALDALLNDYKNKLLLTADENFIAYKNQNFTDEYNYLYYTSPANNKDDLEAFFNYKSEDDTLLENFKHFSYSLINGKDNFRFRMQFANEAQNSGRKQNNLWTMKLDTTSSCKPFGFVNHNTGENEVFVQDDRNNIYLCNAKGQLLWKKNVAEKIGSDVYMVDAFKNNKYQLLFNSKNYLHLIDRNGEYVKGYPVQLKAEATSPLSVLDYEGKKDYRLFIACKNNFIYNYNIQGSLNEGFKNVKTEKEVKLPVQYVKVGQSDYLVTIDVEGKIYTFSRKGENRINLRNRTIANCSSFYIDASTNINNSFLIYVDDKSGAINKISFGDRKEIVNLNYESGSAKVKYTLVDDNRATDLITTHEKTILAYNLNGGLLLEKNTGEELGDADFYSDEAHTLYYALLKNDKKLLIYKPQKQKIITVESCSMPLISELFGDTKKYLIVTNGSWLNCRMIN